MTEKDKEMQELHRKIAKLEAENKKLVQMHQLDIAEIVFQRRLIDRLMEKM